MEKEQEKKKISISIDPNNVKSEPYKEFLFRSSEDLFFIDFAERTDTKDEVKVSIKETISIPANIMRKFVYMAIDEMVKYEKKYKNGYGFNINE